MTSQLPFPISSNFLRSAAGLVEFQDVKINHTASPFMLKEIDPHDRNSHIPPETRYFLSTEPERPQPLEGLPETNRNKHQAGINTFTFHEIVWGDQYGLPFIVNPEIFQNTPVYKMDKDHGAIPSGLYDPGQNGEIYIPDMYPKPGTLIRSRQGITQLSMQTPEQLHMRFELAQAMAIQELYNVAMGKEKHGFPPHLRPPASPDGPT